MKAKAIVQLVATLAAAALVAAGSAVAVELEEAAKVFESLFGEEVRRVALTSSDDDDIELAGRLLDGARASQAQPELVAVLCDHAYTLAVRSESGHPTAVAAMQFLARTMPQRAPDCFEKIIALRQRAYMNSRAGSKQEAGDALLASFLEAAQASRDAGDSDRAILYYRRAVSVALTIRPERRGEIQAVIDQLSSQKRLEGQIFQLASKLEADPSDTAAADELVDIYIVELNDPRRALVPAALGSDPIAKKLVPLVTGNPADVPEAPSLELADWYRRLAASAPPVTRGPLLERSRTFYQRFLSLHTADDLARTRATLALREVEAAALRGSATTVRPTLPTPPTPPTGPAAPTVTAPTTTTATSVAGAKPALPGGKFIFNGSNLAGWNIPYGSTDNWVVQQDGVLDAKGTGDPSRGAWLATDQSYANFVLRFEFRLATGSEGGVSVRSSPGRRGVRIPIVAETGQTPDTSRTGALDGVELTQRAQLRPLGQWNTMQIEVRGNHLIAAVNGRATLDYTFNDPTKGGGPGRSSRASGRAFSASRSFDPTGPIGLRAALGEMQFRRIEVVELP